MAALRFLYDCDPGADDALAMLLSLSRPDALDMIVVACVAGNVSLKPVLNNARRILEFILSGETSPSFAHRLCSPTVTCTC